MRANKSGPNLSPSPDHSPSYPTPQSPSLSRCATAATAPCLGREPTGPPRLPAPVDCQSRQQRPPDSSTTGAPPSVAMDSSRHTPTPDWELSELPDAAAKSTTYSHLFLTLLNCCEPAACRSYPWSSSPHRTEGRVQERPICTSRKLPLQGNRAVVLKRPMVFGLAVVALPARPIRRCPCCL